MYTILPVHFLNHKPFWDSEFRNRRVEIFLTDLISFNVDFNPSEWKIFNRSDLEKYLLLKGKSLDLSIFYSLVDGGSPDNNQSSIEYKPGLICRISSNQFQISEIVIKSLSKYIRKT